MSSELHFLWQTKPNQQWLDLRVLSGLSLIGVMNEMVGRFYSEGNIHGEVCRIVQTAPPLRPPLVKLSIRKGIEFVGQMEWSIGEDGRLLLLKRKRGSNQFHVRTHDGSIYEVSEADGQIVGRINKGKEGNLIWIASVESRQRTIQQAHEILFYAAFLIHKAFPVKCLA